MGPMSKQVLFVNKTHEECLVCVQVELVGIGLLHVIGLLDLEIGLDHVIVGRHPRILEMAQADILPVLQFALFLQRAFHGAAAHCPAAADHGWFSDGGYSADQARFLELT